MSSKGTSLVLAPTAAEPALMCARRRDLSRWLSRHGESVRGPVAIERIGFGQSNITSVVRDLDGREWVLPEPPAGSRNGDARDVHREARIIAAPPTPA